MKTPFKKIILTVIISLLILPGVALAGEYDTDEGTVTFEGLVPCGEEVPCQLCHLFVLINEILHWFWFVITPPIAVLFALIAAFFFIFSGGDPAKVQRARQIAVSLAIGLFLVYGSWALVNTFFTILDVKTFGEGGWSKIECEIKKDPSIDIDQPGGGESSCAEIEDPEICNNTTGCSYNSITKKCIEDSGREIHPNCGKCGKGFWNVCDKAECKEIDPDCIYEGGLVYGTCKDPEEW